MELPALWASTRAGLRMATLAVGAEVSLMATPDVFQQRHGLEMGGIAALANSTEVIYLQVSGDRCYQCLVGHSMRPAALRCGHAVHPIPIAIPGCSPKPAA